MAKEQTPLIYLCIHKKLGEKYKNREFKLKDFFTVIGRGLYRVDKKFYYPILKELENLKLVKRINKNTMKILKTKIDLKNTSKIYKEVGLY